MLIEDKIHRTCHGTECVKRGQDPSHVAYKAWPSFLPGNWVTMFSFHLFVEKKRKNEERKKGEKGGGKRVGGGGGGGGVGGCK